jgi:hypothetical protein
VEICTVLFNGILRAATLLDLFRFIKLAHEMQTKKQSKVTAAAAAAAAVGSMAEKVLGAGMRPETTPTTQLQQVSWNTHPAVDPQASKRDGYFDCRRRRRSSKKKEHKLQDCPSLEADLLSMSCKGQQRHRESFQHLRFSARPRNLEAVLGLSLQYKPHGNGMGLHIPNSDFDLRIQFTRTRRTGRTRMWVLSSCPAVVSLCWSSSGIREE